MQTTSNPDADSKEPGPAPEASGADAEPRRNKAPPDAPIVVGIGGSAGALPALMALFESLGDGSGIALVLVPHLAPDHESHAVEILQRVTPLAVSQVTVRTRLEPGHVYVIAPGMNLITDDGHIQPATTAPKRPTAVIDLFFRSLGEVYGDRGIGVVLSGTGHDGALGLAHIKEYGGLTIAQDPADSEHGEMPQAAIQTGSIDLVLSAKEIGARLVELAKFPRAPLPHPLSRPDDPPTPQIGSAPGDTEPEERAFQDVLSALRVRTRHDFRHYKRGTVLRRLRRRMQVNKLPSIQSYRDYVRSNNEELGPLLADMLISVTNFFRDPEAFAAMEREVIPDLMERATDSDDVRVWVAACASGEESYSIAILLQEYADRMQRPPRLQIFASDINESALALARAGIYPPNISSDVSDARLLACFEKGIDGQYRVRDALRETIVFARHNLLGDPPFSRLDLICCRNLLIYLDRTAQSVVLDVFAYALNPGGYLFLGNAESIDVASAAFEVVDKQHRIYRLRPDAASMARTRAPSQLMDVGGFALPSPLTPQRHFHAVNEQEAATALHERALVAASPPNVLINAAHEIERVSPGAGRFVAFGEGTPTRNLLSNVDADIRVELRTALFRADDSRQPVRSVFRRQAGRPDVGATTMALSIYPVEASDGASLHWLVLFDESAASTIPADTAKVDDSTYRTALQHLEDENRTLKSHLQETLDRSAISNEELKASNEELQAINEELRSAKEELETSKEEMQSVNEELTTVNFELRMKVDEAVRHNDDLRNLIEAADIATIFLDPGMRVKRFTPQASRLFALIPSDVGRSLLDVKSRLRYDEIVDDALSVYHQLRPVERTVASIDDEHYLARIFPYRTAEDKIGGAVLTFVNVTELRRAEDRVRITEERLRDSIAASRDFAVITFDPEGTITTWNEGAARLFGYTQEEIVGQRVDVLYTAADRAAGEPDKERQLAAREGRAADERWHIRSDGSTFFCSGVVTPLHPGSRAGFVKIARDISQSKIIEMRRESELTDERQVHAQLTAAGQVRERFLAVMSHELKQPLNLINVNAELLVRMPESKQSPALMRIGDTIKRAVTAQETIVNDLLDLSRVRTGKLQLHREPVEITALVRRLAGTVAPEVAQKSIELAVDVPDDVVCDGDAIRIEQVVWNLLGNAVKFTPPKGRIGVKVSVDGHAAKLEVSDTGVGIRREVLPTIFELFGQDENAMKMGTRRAGLGIGLTLVRELAEAHGGRVEASSAGPGQGATFSVWLPLAVEGGVADTAGALPSPVFLGRRILLVDDDTDSLDSLAAVLGVEGAVVGTASSGREALRLLEKETYDLLLSDVGMPEMSGIELMRIVRSQPATRGLRTIAITGYGREADVRQALGAGFDAHLSKPVSIERLRRVVASL